MDSGAESNVNYGSLAQEASEWETISEWPRDHSCDILEKSKSAFFAPS